MATFSTNQVKHLYVATAMNTSLNTAGQIAFSNVGDGQIAAKYVTADGIVRTDLIDIATLKAKAIKASAMAQYPETSHIAVTGKTYSDDAVANQQYIIKVTVNEFAGMTFEDKTFIFGEYTAKSGDKVKDVLANLAVSLAKNAAKAAYNSLLKVYVTTQATIGSIAAGNSTEVTATTAVSSLSGNYVGIVIEGADQPFILGKMDFDRVLFDVAADKIIASGVETVWATITKNTAHIAGKTPNSKKIAALEAFCWGERADIYRGMGYPNNFDFKPLVNADSAYGYHILELTWAYQGDAEDIQKSPKELIIAAPGAASSTYSVINAITGANTSATGSLNAAVGSVVASQLSD